MTVHIVQLFSGSSYMCYPQDGVAELIFTDYGTEVNADSNHLVASLDFGDITSSSTSFYFTLAFKIYYFLVT